MVKKEERLSPRARELVEGARTKHYANPGKAIEYLRSVNPSELNLYDRQKVGREILARYNSLGNSAYDAESIRDAYGLLTTKDKKRVEEENKGGKYLEKFKKKKEERRKIFKAKRDERARRGGLNSEEIDDHLSSFKTSDTKINYLNSVLTKTRLLGKGTQANIHEKLGQLYEEAGDNQSAISHYKATGKFIQVPLKEIVKNGVVVGFEVDGFDWTFDGDEHSGRRTYTISPAGVDAPGVFKVIERGDLGWRNYNTTREYIVSGDVEKAKEKAYQLALKYAQGDVNGRNKHAQEDGLRKALLVDETKMAKNSKDLASRLSSIVAIMGIGSGAFFYSTKITGNVVGVSTQTSSLIGVGLLIVGLISGFFYLRNRRKK